MARYALSLVISGSRRSDFGPGDDQDRRVGRDVLLQQDERFGGEVVRLQLLRDPAVAAAVRPADVALAVAR